MKMLNIPLPTAKYFPYKEVRRYQDRMIRIIYNALLRGQHVAIEGPNGLGKTIAVLAASLPIAYEEDLSILYLVRTHKQADRCLEEISLISKKSSVNAVSLKSRGEMCLNKIIANQSLEPQESMEICRILREEELCEFYEKFKSSIKLCEKLQVEWKSRPIPAAKIINVSRREGICPYELTRLLIGNSRVVALSYPYVLDPVIRNVFFKHSIRPLYKTILIFDEAHNLPEISIGLLSKSLSFLTLKRAYEEAKTYGYNEIASFCTKLEKALMELVQFIDRETIVNPTSFVDAMRKTLPTSDIINFLEQFKDIGDELRRKFLHEGKFPRSYIGRMGEFWDFWIRNMKNPAFTYIASTSQVGKDIFPKLEIIALDPSIVTKPVISAVRASVSMSGVLEPIEYYSKIIGLPETTVKEALPFPFPDENLCVLCVKGITVGFLERSPETYEKLVRKCAEIVRFTPGNSAIFASSYEVLEGMLSCGIEELIDKPLLIERREMSSRESDEVIRKFKSYADKGAVLLGVQGGRASEGVDYPGKEMITSIIVGIPYAKPNLRSISQIRFYERLFPKKGYELGYLMPAMKKASQAAGRPIRSPTDKGAIIFLDSRFASPMCKKYLPLWLRERLKVIPDKEGALAKELIAFFGLHS